MFSKKNRDHLRKNISNLEKEKNRRSDESQENYSEEQVRELIEAHTLLGCRFGVFLLFQVQNQEAFREQINSIAKEKFSLSEEEVKDDMLIFKTLMNAPGEFGEEIQKQLLGQFIHDERVNHTQAILVGQAQLENGREELVMAVNAFSDQVDEYYRSHSEEAPLSSSIN